MQFLISIAHSLALFDRKKRTLFIVGVISAALALLGGLVGFLYYQKQNQIATIKALYAQVKKNDALITRHEKVEDEQARVLQLLEDNKGFTLKTFFEQLCQDQKINPEEGWETESRSVPGNETFDEILLKASFKGQTTQKLIQFIQAIENKEIVYLKEVDITKDGAKKIKFSVVLATKKRKQFWDN
jgi:hypothetical protein